MNEKIPVENLPNNFKSISSLAAWCLKSRIGIYGHNTPQARSKFFEDHKRGVLVVENPKNITRDEVLSYFAVAGLTVIEKGNPTYDGELHVKKTAAEIRSLEARAEKAEHELEVARGQYLRKEDVRLELALKIAVFEAGFKTMVRVNAADWISKCGGNTKKEQLFCDLVFAEIDALLKEFGNMEEIKVVMAKGSLPWEKGLR